MAEAGGPVGSRRPGRRGRRVVAPPTGAPGEQLEQPLPHEPGPDEERDAHRWAAEAARLRSERPPHWG